jgi:hypothetical protein
MLKIDNLNSIEGRKLLQRVYLELKYTRQLSGISVIFIMWRLCTSETNFAKFTKQDILLQRSLGFLKGTSLWLQEVVNRFYYSTVNSFVYFGAALILLVVGVRRFRSDIPDTFVISAIIFETLMLLLLFVVMFFSPSEDEVSDSEIKSNDNDLIIEIGELSRDIAQVAVNLESINDNLRNISSSQNQLVEKLENIAIGIINSTSPNPEMLTSMNELNLELKELKINFNEINNSVELIKSEEIKALVKIELEKIIAQRI